MILKFNHFQQLYRNNHINDNILWYDIIINIKKKKTTRYIVPVYYLQLKMYVPSI